MAKNTLAKNIGQAVTDFADIKTAIIEKGVNVPGGTPTAEYDDLIRQIADVDLSNVVKFDDERNVNLQGEGDLIVDNSKTVKLKDASDEIRALSAATGTFLSIVNIPVGYNLRGKTIVFAPDDAPSIEIINNCRINIDIKPVNYAGYIEVAGQYITVFDEYNNTNRYIYSRPDSGWIQKTYTFPNDNDYIVTSNNLGESNMIADYGEYSLRDAYVDNVSAGFNLSVGDTDHHTAIQSKDRPTWNNGTDSKEIATTEQLFKHVFLTQAEYDALGNSVIANGVTYFIIGS